MADIEKDGLNMSDDTNSNENEQLEKELDEIRELFQKELDIASAEQQDGERELIQPLDEIEEQADEEKEEQPDSPLCQCCEENLCSTEYGEGYPYCDQCRNLMVKYPIRFSGILAFILTAVLFIGGLFLAQNEIYDSATVLEASTAFAGRHLTTAAEAYSAYFSGSTSSNVSKRAVREAIECFASLGSVSNVISIVENNYSDEDLEKSGNKEIKEIYSFCKKIDATTQAVYESIVYPTMAGYIKPEDAIAQLKEFSAAIDTEKAEEETTQAPEDETTEKADSETTEAETQPEAETEYDKVVAEYYIYYIMVNSSYDADARYKQIKKIAELGNEDYEWMYAPALAMAAAEQGDLDLLTKCCEIVKENNRDDVSAYVTLAHYYSKQEKIDADKVIEICQQADEAFPGGNEVSHYRYYAVAYLLKGDAEKALSYMKQYTAEGIRYYSDANLYAVCGIAAKDDTVYDEMVETLTGYGYKISKYVDKFKAGKMTVEELFRVGGGEFI